MTERKKDSINTPAKPFLKWAGSKRQLLSRFDALYPPALKAGKIKNYYEPFTGGGAVFFDIIQRYTIKNSFLFDVNQDLVLTYSVLQDHTSKLVKALQQHESHYLALSKEKRSDYYYAQRTLFNAQRPDATKTTITTSVQRAAQFIFLNRTCFNGLFRVNSKGIFNTPAGDYAKPLICDEANLRLAAKLLTGASIQNADFSAVLKKVTASSFVYFDPPYRPLNRTASFTAYNQAAFTDQQQMALAAVYRKLDKKGAMLMLSNSDPGDGFFDKLYKGFYIKRVPAKRLINADASKRGFVNEIIITNYPV